MSGDGRGGGAFLGESRGTSRPRTILMRKSSKAHSRYAADSELRLVGMTVQCSNIKQTVTVRCREETGAFG